MDWLVDGHDLESDARGSLAVSNGLLAAQPAPGAERLPGRFFLSGLVDAHVHLAFDLSGSGQAVGSPTLIVANLQTHLRSGVLLARDLGAPVGVRLGGEHPEGPSVLAAGRFLAPAGGHVAPLYEPISDDDMVEVALAELVAGHGWVKVVFDFPECFAGVESLATATPNFTVEQSRRLCDAVHAAGGRVAAHVSGFGNVGAAIDAGVDSLEHGLDINDDEIRRLADRGGAWTPTLTTIWRHALGSPADVAEHLRHAIGTAAQAGLTVLVGTDTTPHGTIAEEMALLVRFGMSPESVLAAASSNARAYFGRPARTVGVPADVVTYHDDPRDDLQALTRPAAILRQGRRVL